MPSLRNLELTAPYFHNGGQRTIRQVVEFYNRGGDFREHNVLNIDFEVGKLNLTEQEIDDLVAFLGRPLTDPRVVQQRAPFDHPQLFVPNGHQHAAGAVRASPTTAWRATSCWRSRRSGGTAGPRCRGSSKEFSDPGRSELDGRRRQRRVHSVLRSC